jgi:predicted  nucleic acid-binding Zn-ribbon protein
MTEFERIEHTLDEIRRELESIARELTSSIALAERITDAVLKLGTEIKSMNERLLDLETKLDS